MAEVVPLLCVWGLSRSSPIVVPAQAGIHRRNACASFPDAGAYGFPHARHLCESPFLCPGEGRGPVGGDVGKVWKSLPNWTPAFAGVRQISGDRATFAEVSPTPE